jgi:hypothetical protein
LTALVVLPAIWWLLRVTPPAPRRVIFPPLRLLLGIASPEETPARTPPWLLLLRLIAAALIIFALAGPSIGTPPKPAGAGPLVLFIDNDWAAAHGWKVRQAAINDALNGAARADRAATLVPTASGETPQITLLDAAKAQRSARELQPQPWAPDRARAAEALAKMHFSARPQILWFSDGLDHDDARATRDALSKIGNVTLYTDQTGKVPLGLTPETSNADGFKLTVIRAGGEGALSGTVEAIGARGENLANASFRFAPGRNSTAALIRLPLELRNETERLVIANEDSAGAVRLLDTSSKRRKVGLVAANGLEEEEPLLSGLFFLSRALAPYADVSKGTISDVLGKDVSVLILSDIGRIAGADYGRVEKFVADGGVLVRFAGARMTQATDDLVPVKLRTGGRYLGGAMGWAEPQHLAPFPQASPFRGLQVPKDVTVSRQVLAEPSVELSERSWARLTDGTPLVTAEQRGKGWIVLFHVTASPAWSSLPLSRLYIDMLRRVLALSGGAHPADMATGANASFPPLQVLDGFGHSMKPPAEALPIRGDQLARIAPSREHPPGLYGGEGASVALNVVKDDTVLEPLPALAVARAFYTGSAAMELAPWLLTAAILLLFADALIALHLRGLLRLPRRFAGTAGAAVLGFVLLAPHHARADDSFDMQAALNTRLAYVVTGVSDVDAMSKAGLTGLGLWLKARTSYEPEAPLGVDLAHDNLAFFPLIYWPMDPREKDLTPEELTKLQDYMNGGGTLLIDTRDLTLGPTRGADNPGEETLKRLLGKLDLPPLEPVPSNHVLTKAFYILQDFPGRWAGGKVWVEALPPGEADSAAPARGGDGVSPVIIGGNDWAAAWAVDSQMRPIADCTPGGDRQREMAIRFGINVVMYAMTGNYKADQVHVPALLQRLGK